MPAETVGGEGKGGTTGTAEARQARAEAPARAGRPAAWPGRPVLPVPRARLPARAEAAAAPARPERQATAEPAARRHRSDAAEPAAAPARPRAAAARRPEVGPAAARGGARAARRRRRAGPRERPARAERRRLLKKFVGNIDTRGQVRSDFNMYWDQLSPENAGKWGSRRGDARPDELDRPSTRCTSTPRTTTSPSSSTTSSGAASSPAGSAACRRPSRRDEVEEWIRLFCERYPDTAPHRRRQRAAAAHDAVLHGRARRRRRQRIRLDRAGVHLGASVLPERRS